MLKQESNICFKSLLGIKKVKQNKKLYNGKLKGPGKFLDSEKAKVKSVFKYLC